MTKKHFQAFADSIKATKNADDAERFADVCIGIFKAENARFDAARFYAACGLNVIGDRDTTPKKLNRQSRVHRAREILTACNIESGVDFHTLHSNTVDALLEFATQERYRKPRNANGSRARCYHDRLQRLARDVSFSGWVV